MDKWEKVVTLKRKLTDLKHGCTLEELQDCLECDRSTVYRVKILAEMLFGIDIIKDRNTKKFRFDFENSELTELPGIWFKKSELEALICLQHAMSCLQREYLHEILEPFRTRCDNWEIALQPLNLTTYVIKKLDWNAIIEFIKTDN